METVCKWESIRIPLIQFLNGSNLKTRYELSTSQNNEFSVRLKWSLHGNENIKFYYSNWINWKQKWWELLKKNHFSCSNSNETNW